jgi:hypothetical protein
MTNKLLWIFLIFSIVIIGVLTWLLLVTPAHAPTTSPTPTPTTTAVTPTPSPAANAPLHDRVIVTSPKSGGTVGKTFTITGEAPGNWFFEATFPIQVRDPKDDVIGRIGASALGEWMTTGQVAFKATLYLDGSYSGPATLILLKDNPSGLPENDDSLEIPIVIK